MARTGWLTALLAGTAIVTLLAVLGVGVTMGYRLWNLSFEEGPPAGVETNADESVERENSPLTDEGKPDLPSPAAEKQRLQDQATLSTSRTYAQRTGSVFTPAPDDPFQPPRVVEVSVPQIPNGYAIWGSIGRDDRGHIWYGVSARDVPSPSAHLFELDPETRQSVDRGSVVEELRKAGVYRPGEGQMKIHSKIFQANDGYLYFCSMDEHGEASDGTRLPTWGSHLWRLRLDDYRWEHLWAAKEGLIAAGCTGRYVYTLGYFNHTLYRYDTQTSKTRRIQVGSLWGHISRNLIVDGREHVFVPRVKRQEDGSATAFLVEYDTDLNEIAETPLKHYLEPAPVNSHGILGFAYMRDGSIVFNTHVGYLYRITPPPGSDSKKPAKVDPIGQLHPKGPSYVAAFFTLDGERYVAGANQKSSARFEWVVYDLATFQSRVFPIAVVDFVEPPRNSYLMYGSNTRDDRGRFYVVGWAARPGDGHSMLLQLESLR